MSELNLIKCSRCNKNKIVDDFISKDGKVLKSCIRCREGIKINVIKNLCPHKKIKYKCRDCGGSGFCIHKKDKQKCLDCGGSAMCIHKKEKFYCRDCNGSGFCEHGNRKYICKDCNGNGICIHNKLKQSCIDCGGGSICIHKKEKRFCIECDGSAICKHKKMKRYCRECDGSAFCEHKKEKTRCKLCYDAVDITIKSMLNCSKTSDKKYNRYDENNFIDYDYVKKLIIESKNKCCYCHNEVQFINYDKDLVTIERNNNSLGHIKGNCLIACKLCNISRVGDYLRDYLEIA